MGQFRVTKASPEDAKRFVEIQFAAFENDPFMEALYPGDYYAPATRDGAVVRMIADWKAADEHTSFWKCEDAETNEIAAFAKWEIIPSKRAETEWNQPPTVSFADAKRREIAGNFLGALFKMRSRIFGGEPHILLDLLCVDPKYQRKGVGTELVNWGIEESEKLRLPLYLAASTAGTKFYPTLNFQTVDKEVVTAAMWDGQWDIDVVGMLRNPASLVSAE